MPDAIDKAAIERGRDLLVIALRGLIYNRMAELGVTHADLAGRVGCTPKELNRVLMGRGMSILPFARMAAQEAKPDA